MSSKLFERAAFEGWRFESVKGELTIVNLCQLPLTSNDDCNLDVIYLALDEVISSSSTSKSIIRVVNKDVQLLKDKLELVKYIIETKMAEKQAEAEASTKAAKAKQLRLLRAEKEAEATKGLTLEEIDAQLKELEA